MADLPFHEIPAPPSAVSPGTVLSRLAEGIGFRLRWATEGIEEGDLAFRPAPDCLSLGDLLGHVHGLLRWVASSVGVDRGSPGMGHAAGIAAREAAIRLAASLASRLGSLGAAELEACTVKPSRGESYPFWNLVNGPLADALTHVGQIASWRRIMGKPIPGADVFRGLPPAQK